MVLAFLKNYIVVVWNRLTRRTDLLLKFILQGGSIAGVLFHGLVPDIVENKDDVTHINAVVSCHSHFEATDRQHRVNSDLKYFLGLVIIDADDICHKNIMTAQARRRFDYSALDLSRLGLNHLARTHGDRVVLLSHEGLGCFATLDEVED